MTIHIEICKSFKKNKWNMRVGTLDGYSEMSNFSQGDIIKEIKEQFKIEEELKEKENGRL
jgi:hypothetical protein